MKHLKTRILALGMALCLCLSLCALPASAVDTTQMPEEGTYGPITLSLQLEESGDGYSATYSASTTMIDWLAQAAAVCKDDPRMANLRFTCTLKDALTAKLGAVSGSDYTFTSAKYGGNDIFVADTPDAVTVSGGALMLRYKLNPVVLAAWSGETTENVKTALKGAMTMTASKAVSKSDLADVGGTIRTTARIDISMTEGKIPFYQELSVLAAYGECSVNNPEYSGGSERRPNVQVKDVTKSMIDPATGEPYPSDVPVGGGKTTVENPYARPGENVRIKTNPDRGSMVNYIRVKGKDGKSIPVTNNGQGLFTFVMPEDGTATVEALYRVIPADPKEIGVAELLNADDHILYMIGNDKGYFCPNDSISRAEVATAFFRLLRNQNVEITTFFDDVLATSWYYRPVGTLATIGILRGVGNGMFEPERKITRAEFATVAVRFANKLVPGKSFKDVDENAWYAPYVSTAAQFGWINGVGNGMFEPDRLISRTEAAAIINRMLMRTSDWIDVDAGAGRHFPDVDEDFWGKYDISEATNGHDHSFDEEFFYEDWLNESWREAVDNDPVNFGQPIF